MSACLWSHQQSTSSNQLSGLLKYQNIIVNERKGNVPNKVLFNVMQVAWGNVQDFQDSGVTFDFGPHLRMLNSSIWERGEGVGHYTNMPCQCGYPDGMSPRGRMVFSRAEPEGNHPPEGRHSISIPKLAWHTGT